MRFRVLTVSCALGLSAIFLTSCGGNPSSSSAPNIPTTGFAYHCASGTNQVNAYALNSNGAALPTLAYTLPAGTSCGPIVSDRAGKIYLVAESTTVAGNVTVEVLTANAGTLTPIRSFTATPGIVFNLAADKDGTVYMATGYTLQKFSSSASGAATPLLNLNSYMNEQLIVDNNGNLFSLYGTDIHEFAKGFSTATPFASMDVSSSFRGGVYALAIDSFGTMYLTGVNNGLVPIVAAYPTFTNGPGTPTRTITSSSFNNPTDIAVDDSGTLTVADYNTSSLETLSRYSTAASGNVSPLNFFIASGAFKDTNVRTAIY